MTRHWLTGLALAATLLTTAAHAETVRLPETGDPAFTVALPDGWTHEAINSASLKAFSANHAALLNLNIVKFSGTLEELAAGAMKSPDGMPPQNTGPVDISGYGGSSFDGTLVSADGVHAKVHLVAVKLDDGHVAVATLLTADNLDAAQADAAMAVLKSATLTHPAPPPAPAPEPPPPPAAPTPPAATVPPPASPPAP